jgi:hypothetical protein
MTFDIACFQWPTNNSDSVVQRLADNKGGAIVTGANKLVQRVLIELLTEQGSQLYSNRGTVFLTRLRTNVYSELDVLIAFSSVRTALRANLQSEELTTDPPEERYLDSYIDRITIGSGVVQIRLNIKSRAGTVTPVTLPVLVFEYN